MCNPCSDVFTRLDIFKTKVKEWLVSDTLSIALAHTLRMSSMVVWRGCLLVMVEIAVFKVFFKPLFSFSSTTVSTTVVGGSLLTSVPFIVSPFMVVPSPLEFGGSLGGNVSSCPSRLNSIAIISNGKEGIGEDLICSR